jgi:hypothetical protein
MQPQIPCQQKRKRKGPPPHAVLPRLCGPRFPTNARAIRHPISGTRTPTLVPPNDPPALAVAIEPFNAARIRARYGAAEPRLAEDRLSEAIGHATVSLYRSLTNNRKALAPMTIAPDSQALVEVVLVVLAASC